MENLVLYLSSATFGGVGAWFFARWGVAFGFLDKAIARSSHEGVVPKGGGVGILVSFLFVSWLLEFPILFWMCIGLVSLLSFYGDYREISPRVRLAAHFLGSICILLSLFYFGSRGWSFFLLIPFYALFVVGTANYYNFMDGINGIAGITGVIAFGLIALFVSLSGGDDFFITLSLCMGLACMGFLPFNIPKARVFMGDVGSIMLGFVYAWMVVGLSYSLNDFMVLCAFLFPFYADELLTLCIRLRHGESLLKPHRRHFYQLLANEMGIDHWKVSVGYGVLQLMVGLGVLAIRGYGDLAVMIFLGCCFVGFGIVSFIVRSSQIRASLRAMLLY